MGWSKAHEGKEFAEGRLDLRRSWGAAGRGRLQIAYNGVSGEGPGIERKREEQHAWWLAATYTPAQLAARAKAEGWQEGLPDALARRRVVDSVLANEEVSAARLRAALNDQPQGGLWKEVRVLLSGRVRECSASGLEVRPKATTDSGGESRKSRAAPKRRRKAAERAAGEIRVASLLMRWGYGTYRNTQRLITAGRVAARGVPVTDPEAKVQDPRRAGASNCSWLTVDGTPTFHRGLDGGRDRIAAQLLRDGVPPTDVVETLIEDHYLHGKTASTTVEAHLLVRRAVEDGESDESIAAQLDNRRFRRSLQDALDLVQRYREQATAPAIETRGELVDPATRRMANPEDRPLARSPRRRPGRSSLRALEEAAQLLDAGYDLDEVMSKMAHIVKSPSRMSLSDLQKDLLAASMPNRSRPQRRRNQKKRAAPPQTTSKMVAASSLGDATGEAVVREEPPPRGWDTI